MIDGAAWLLLRIEAGLRNGVEPPIADPGLWTWEATRWSLALAQQGNIVKPHRRSPCPGS